MFTTIIETNFNFKISWVKDLKIYLMASTQLDKLERVKLDNFRLVSKYVFTSKTLAPFNFDENKNTRIVMYLV